MPTAKNYQKESTLVGKQPSMVRPNQVRTQPRKMKPSSKASARSIAALDQNRMPTNNVDNAIVTVATGMIG